MAEAETLAKAVFERGTAAGEIDATGGYGLQLVAIRRYQGHLAHLPPMLTELAHSPCACRKCHPCWSGGMVGIR